MPVVPTARPGGGPGAAKHAFAGKFTWYSFLCCAAASSGGLLFGYDLGVAGGVSTMEDFQKRFFPDIHDNTQNFRQLSPWCTYDSQVLALFNSSLYLAALIAAIVGSQTSHRYGRKFNMLMAGLFYLAGALVNGVSYHISMVILGRILLGIGVGLANSSVTIYANEMAPAKWRGGLNMMFQLATTIGIVVAQVMNWGLEEHPWGWRVSLAIAGIPALVIVAAGILLPESPTWLIEKGHNEKAKLILIKARGVGADEAEAEFQDMKFQTQIASQTTVPFFKMFKWCYFPHLWTSFAIAAGQQLTCINSIMFYVAQIFSTIGTGRSAALEAACVMGAVNVAATFVGIIVADRAGRRPLLVVSGALMAVFEVLCGALINHFFQTDGGKLTASHAKVILALICLYVANFAWSFGPLGWLVPSEIQPAEIRTSGMAFATAINMAFTFIIGQAFLTMMCKMQQGVFYFFAGWCALQAVYLAGFLPETKGLHIEQVHEAFAKHWFWKRFPQPPRNVQSVAMAELAPGNAEQGEQVVTPADK